MYNVIKQDIECSCFTCSELTRYYVIEFDHWLCLECIKILSSVEIIGNDYLTRLDRHINN